MRLILILLGLLFAAFLISYIDFGRNDPEPEAGPVSSIVAQTANAAQAADGGVPIGGAFSLHDDSGKVVTEKDLADGKMHHLLFFGFTHCPDKCPGMLQTVAWVMDNLPKEKQGKVKMVFVSVDPTRDSDKSLGEYVRGFNPNFVGWTGTKAEIDQMTKNYLAYYAVMAPEDKAKPDEYAVDHSTYLYLMGPDGKYIQHFRNSDSASHIRDGVAAVL